MESVITVSGPIFMLILSGFIGARSRVLGRGSSEALNLFVFYFALPALLLKFVSEAPLDDIFNWSFLAAWAAGLGITALIAGLLAVVVYRDSLEQGTMRTVNAVFANTGYMGIPLLLTAFGEKAVLPAIMATVFLALVVTSLAIALIEIGQSGGGQAHHVLRDVAWSLIRNPVVVPVAGGILMSASGLSLPAPFYQFVDMLGSTAGPCALFAIGLFIAGQDFREGLGEVGVLVLLKLIIQPFITWILVSYVFEMEPIWAAAAVLTAALPNGATCFVFAQRYGVFVETTSAATLLSTIVSVATISILLALLGNP